MPAVMLPVFKIYGNSVLGSKLAQESKNNTAGGKLWAVWAAEPAKVKKQLLPLILA